MKKKYLYNGEYYTESEMNDFAKQSGVSFDSYIAALGKDVKVLDAPYEYKGNFYTQDEISAAAKKKGINDDAYLSQNGIKKKEEAYTGGAMSSAASKIGGQVGNFVGQSEKDNALSLIQSINAGITKGIEKGKQQFPNEIRATPEEEAALRDAQRRTGQADGLFTQQGAEQFNLLATDPLRAILDPEREKLQTAYNNRRLQGVRQTSDNTIARNNIDPNKTVQKKDGKLIPDVSSNPEYQVKNQEQALENVSGLVKNKFFKNGKEALEYAENQVKSGIDPTGNETIEHAITKAGEYKQKEESALNGKSIIQNAIEIQLQNDPLFKKQYETIINGTASDAEIADVARRFNIPLDKLKTQGSLPQEVVGELVHRFISDPDIKQIAEDNPEFKKDFDNFTGDKIYEVFPEYADVYIKNTLSRARELDGKNNWFANPIFDKSKYMDNLAEEVFKDRPILLKRVKDKFHNNWEHKIETTGIVDDLATGARGAMSGMWRSLKDVSGFGESYSDRIRNTLKEQYGHVETPHQNEFRKVVGEASNFMGMVLAMGATGSGLGNIGKGLGVMNPSVASKAVTLATFFDDELNHAASIYPENPTKAYLRASLSTAFFLVAGDAIPASKITGFKQNITQTLKSLETKALDKQAKMKLRDKILSVATETLQGTAKGTAEMTVMINGFKLLIDRALGLDESSINNEYSDANLLATAKSMLFGLPVPSMIHGFKGINRTRAAIYEMASNPEKYKSAILKRFGSDDHRIADIDFIADFKKYLDSMRVAENEKAKMVFNALHAKRLREQKSPDAFMKRNHEEEIRAIEQEQQDIMDGKDSDAGLTDSQKAIKTAYENGEINEMMEAQIKEALKDPAKADQFIKEIAEQATGAVAPELGNAKDGAIKFFGETLTDFAIGKSGKKGGGESVVFEYENEGEVPQKLKPLMVKDENGRITITMPKDEADALQKRIAEGLEPDMELMDGTLIKKADIKIKDVQDGRVKYKGEEGTIYQDGQTLVFKVDGKEKEYELGNVNDISDKPISELGIEQVGQKEVSVVSVADNGNVVVREQEYVNNYSDPFSAINRDSEGNVISVTLDTKDGKKRTFRGSVADDIAYQITLKEIEKNNETKSNFEQFINTDESKQTINDTRLQETAEKSSDKTTEPISPIPTEQAEALGEQVKAKMGDQVSEGTNKEALEYAIEKIAEAPIEARKQLGDELFEKVLEATPTEKLQEGLDFLIDKNSDDPNVKELDKIIFEREKKGSTPEQKSEWQKEQEAIDNDSSLSEAEKEKKKIESTAKQKSDPDLANIDPVIIAARNGDKQAQKKLEEYGLDWEQTTTYRFVGQPEVDVLLSDKKVESKRFSDAGIDVTTSPKVTSAANAEYRVTFKESFDVNNGLGKVKVKSKEEGDHNLEKGRGYTLNDVAKIERLDENGNVVEVIYDSESLLSKEQQPSVNKGSQQRGNPALSSVESTAKALEGVKEFKAESDRYFEYVPIEEIEKYKEFDRATEKKWGRVDNTLEELVADIQKNGIKTPITLQVDRNNNALVVEGNTRLAAAKKLGIKNIPVRIISGEFGSINKDKTKKLGRKRGIGEMNVFYPYVNILNQENSPAKFGFTSITNTKNISEAYHKAKKDGSNPELVKAVEDLLGKKPSNKAENKPTISKEQLPTDVSKEEGSGVGGEVVEGETKVVNGRELTFYNIKGRDDGSGFAVEKGSDGYVIQSAMIPMGIQRQGIGTRFYVRMNEESVKNTGNPLRSSDRLSNSAGKPFWENLVKNGYAEKTGDGYIFKSQQTLTEKQKLDREKLASLTGKKMTDAEFLDYEKRVADRIKSNQQKQFTYREIKEIAKKVKGGTVAGAKAESGGGYTTIFFHKYTDADAAISKLRKEGYNVSDRQNNPTNFYSKFKITVEKPVEQSIKETTKAETPTKKSVPEKVQEEGGGVGGDVEATAKKIVGESAFDKLKKEGYTIEKGKFDSDAYASFFGLHTGVQADEFANAGLRLVKPSEKIKVYRGKGKNVSEGENEGVTWVAEDKKVAENYSNDGNVEEIEVTKPKNPFPNPTDTIHVKGSDVGNKLKGILNRLFREGKVTKEQAIEASKAIDEFVLAAGEESELYSTKTNKKGVSSKYVKALQALGFDGIVQKESYNSGSPFTATKTGNETNTYGIFKALEQSPPTQEVKAEQPTVSETPTALRDVESTAKNDELEQEFTKTVTPFYKTSAEKVVSQLDKIFGGIGNEIKKKFIEHGGYGKFLFSKDAKLESLKGKIKDTVSKNMSLDDLAKISDKDTNLNNEYFDGLKNQYDNLQKAKNGLEAVKKELEKESLNKERGLPPQKDFYPIYDIIENMYRTYGMEQPKFLAEMSLNELLDEYSKLDRYIKTKEADLKDKYTSAVTTRLITDDFKPNVNEQILKAVESLLSKEQAKEQTPTALRDVESEKKQIEDFGVAKEDVEATHGLLGRVFDGLKKAGLTAAKNVGEWVGIGKGTEKPYSLKIDGKDTQVKNVQPEVVNGFYSPLEKIITESKFDKLPAKQWAEKYANSEEAKWTGLKDWLAKQQGSVSKADIQQYLKDNRIQVVEVVKGEDMPNYKLEIEPPTELGADRMDLLGDLGKAGNLDNPRFRDYLNKKYGKNGNKIYDWLVENATVEGTYSKDTKFSEYQLAGEKENYKEVLVTMPSRTPNYTPITELPSGYDITFDSRNNTYAVIEENQTSGKSITGRYHNTKEDAVKNAIEVINAQRKNVITGKAFDNQFKSSHFDEPNILVHLRMNTRTDAEGNKVLFLEEVQSDWGQKGKKEGFADQLTNTEKQEYYRLMSEKGKRELSDVESKRYTELNDKSNSFHNKKTPSAPFVTDTNAWTKLGLKVALKEAVKQGANKVAWSTGTQQFDRWGSEKISWKKEGNKWKIDLKEQESGNAFDGINIDEKALAESNVSVSSKEQLKEVLNRNLRRERNDAEIDKLTDRIWNRMQTEDSGTSLPRKEGMEEFYGNPKDMERAKDFTVKKEGDVFAVKDEKGKTIRTFKQENEANKFKENYGLGIVGNVAKSLFKQEPKTVDIFQSDKLASGWSVTVKDKQGYVSTQMFDSKSKGLAWLSEQEGLEVLSSDAEGKNYSTQHSIDITPELKASVEGGQPLFKDAEAQYRIESGKNIVEAIKDFNGSPRATVALTHEIMHPTVVEIFNGAKEGNETGLRHANTIVEEYNKANPDKKVTVQQMIEGNDAFINGRTTPEYRAVQEFIAEAWEKYHHEGAKGFSKAFQEVLDAITEVFRQVYKSLTGTTLTPELRKMFDELLGKENVSEVVKAPEISSKAKNKFSNLREKIKQKQSLKIVSDEAENRHANSKLTEADNPVQEPNVKALESEGENAKNAAQAENVIIKIDSIISAATDVGLRKVSDISTDEKRFQGRDKLNAEKVQEIAENWKDADQDPIHVWTDPKDGKTYVLSGHHRLAAAKQAGREKVKVIDRSKDFTEEQAIRFAKEEANANRTMETAIERANTLRQKRERGDTKDDINKFLDREGKNKNFVNNLSRLNPKGKTIEALRATEKSDDKVTQKEVEKIADWIGEARDRNKNLTDAHENELFDFLMDREGSKRITTKQDFLSKVNSLAGAMDFNANEPLNIARYKHKTEGEKLYDKEAETQKGKISDLQQRINEINDRIKNPNNPQYLNPDSKDYEEIKKNADNKLSELNTELQAESKALLDLYQQKGKFARQGTEQSSLFSTEKNETELPEDYYNDLRDIIKDLKDEHKGITLDEIKEIAKNELGEYYSEPDIEAAYKMTEPQPPKSAPEPPKSAPSRPDKSVLTNIVNAENTPPEVKKKLTAHGLKYDPESHDEALQIARAVIDSLGIDAAVTEARARNFGGAVNTFIQTEALNALYKKEAQAKTAQEKYEAAEKFAEVSIALDEWARGDAGRGISALATFYQKSPLGMVLKENKSRKEEFNQWAKGKEESWDEFLERLNKTPEFSDYVSEKVQTELREERKKERSKFFKKVDDTLDKWINDLESGNVAFSSVVPPKLIAEALKGVKAAFKVGESATKIIGDAIDYISDKIGDNWDKDTFRAKIEKALNLRAEKTSVDRYADSLKKQIEELQKQIDAGSRNKNQSNKRQLTPEEQSLLDEKKRLQKELNDIDPKTTFAQRIQKQIDDIQRQIDAGKRDEKERKNKKEYSEEEKELQEKLKAKKAELEALSPLKNTESYKLAELDKFREKLKGLSEAEKDEVVSKAYKKLLDNGALDHADLREIIAKATGRGNLTEKQAARLQELNETINAAEIAKQKHLKERTEQTLKEYHKAIDMSAKAKRDLANEFDKKTDYLKVISSSIQGNTLGLLNVAVMNPLYNITTHLALRLPIGTVQSLFGLALGKAEMNTVFGKPMQAEFFGKGGRGFREAFKGLLTGMNKADYESKEIFSSQIRPNRSLRALLGKDNREAKMKLQEKLFHTFSVFPGATAETNFRLLNFGDKPMRYSASAATAAAFAKKYGIKFNTMDWKTFMEFPREIVKEMELAKGKSLKEAEQEAEYVVRSIEKEGERSTMQQDNFFSDMLEKVFSGGKHEGAKSLAKTLTISPFVKIPSNVLWLGYNLVHPQIALAQAAAHTIRSYGYRGKGEIAESKLQMREARYWMSVTMMGAALQAVMIPLIKAGIITAANDEDDSKKKRIADLTYQPQGMFNMTKFWAYLSGKNVNEVQGGFEIPLKYFGLPGALGNSLARDYKQLTPEQKENRRLLTDNLLELFDADDFKDIENGIFSSSSSLLQGLKGGDMTYYAGNMVNLFTNLIQPAAVSEFSRAAIPYRISGKFDSLGDKIKNDLSNRSALFRKLTGKYPKGKRNIWGEIIKKDDSYANRYFGFNNVTKDNFAQFIYEDAQKWDDEDFLPPTVSNSLGGKKLTAEQLDELEENIGLARKEFIRAYTNDIALIEELGKNYSDILGRDAKKAALQYLYQKGRKLGVDMFVSKHPEFENVVSEEEKQVEELLKNFKEINLISEDEINEKIKH